MVKSWNIEEHMKEIEDKRKRRPVFYFFNDNYYRIKHWIAGLPLRIKSFFQRGKRGWADCDTWDFDSYLADVISKGVEHLRINSTGHSNGLTEKEWDNILKEIIWTFETYKKIRRTELIYIPSEQFTWKKYNQWKSRAFRWKVMKKSEVLRFEKGFDLFKKYFFDLWD